MLLRLFNYLLALLRSVWMLLKSPFQSHPCAQCSCTDYSDEALFMWMGERRAHVTYEDEMLSADIIGRPLKCSHCNHARERHGTLPKRILTSEYMPDGGRIFVEQQRRAVLLRREQRFASAVTKQTRPAVDVTVVAEGHGIPAKGGDVVLCHYDAFVQKSMERFETSRGGEAFRFTVGAAQVVAGWEMGLKGIKKGGRRKIVIPPHLAYHGRQICGERNVTILFDVEVLDIEVC